MSPELRGQVRSNPPSPLGAAVGRVQHGHADRVRRYVAVLKEARHKGVSEARIARVVASAKQPSIPGLRKALGLPKVAA